jgi:hypothetical protein
MARINKKLTNYQTITNLDVVNPTLLFLSEVKGTEEINQKPIAFESKTITSNDKEIKYKIRSYYFINSEENKLFSTIQAIIENKKLEMKQIITKDKIKIKDSNDKLTNIELEQPGYQLSFNSEDVFEALNISKESIKRSYIKRLENLISKLNNITIEMNIKNLKTGNTRIPAPHPLYKINIYKSIGKNTRFEIITTPLNFWNISEKNKLEQLDQNSDIEKDFKEHPQLKQYTSKTINPFKELKGIEINIYQILTYNFNVNKALKTKTYKIEELAYLLYKHEDLENPNNAATLKIRRKYIRTKIRSLIKKKEYDTKFKIELNNEVIIFKIS